MLSNLEMKRITDVFKDMSVKIHSPKLSKVNLKHHNIRNLLRVFNPNYPVRFQLKSDSVFMLCAKLLTKCIEIFDSHSRSPLRPTVKISGLLRLRPRISNASQLSNNAMSWPHSAEKHGDYIPFMAIKNEMSLD